MQKERIQRAQERTRRIKAIGITRGAGGGLVIGEKVKVRKSLQKERIWRPQERTQGRIQDRSQYKNQERTPRED